MTRGASRESPAVILCAPGRKRPWPDCAAGSSDVINGSRLLIKGHWLTQNAAASNRSIRPRSCFRIGKTDGSATAGYRRHKAVNRFFPSKLSFIRGQFKKRPHLLSEKAG